MKKLELNYCGLVAMTESEMRETDGGKLPFWAWALWAVALVVSLVVTDTI